MRENPPRELVDLLSRLHLATPQQVQAVAGRARKLAFDMPLFESVWIDALAQARLLTPYQAAQINAGLGEQLLVGPYVIQKLVQRLGYADCFLAKEVAASRPELSAENNLVDLKTRLRDPLIHVLVARNLDASHAEQAAVQLQSKIEQFANIKSPAIVPLETVGFVDNTLWAAYAPAVGFPAIDWLSCQGRLPPIIVLEIARQMVAALAALEASCIGHGDISASSLWLSESGKIHLTNCGLRSALRVNSSERLDELPLEALDYLAPELTDKFVCPEKNASLATKPNQDVSIDMYACGGLWWHLLAGRPPFVGGDLDTKLAAIRRAEIPNIRQIAPDTSPALANVIDQCTRSDRQERPQSFAELAEKLGLPTSVGRRRLATVLLRSGRRTVRPDLSHRVQRGLQRTAQPLLATAACAFLLAAATWPLWKPHRETSDHHSVPSEIASISGRGSSTTTQENIEPRRITEADHPVRQVNYQTADESHSNEPRKQEQPTPAAVAKRRLIELAGKTEIAAATLRLEPGAVVHGAEQNRPVVVVPPKGLNVAADNVRFENIDFLWRPRPEEIVSPDRNAMVNVRAAHAEFSNCTFNAVRVEAFDLPTAIRLEGGGQSAALPPAAHVNLDRCLLSNVACAIDCPALGPLAIEITNTLHLGHGPLVRFPATRRVDSPTAITLAHVTVRSATAVMEFNCDNADDGAGLMNVTATDCVFTPAADGALLALTSHRSRAAAPNILKALEWNGQGSLVDSHAALLQWQRPEGRESLPADELPLEGLVSSGFDFTGLPTTDPATSRLAKWSAPLQSDQPPGIGDDLPTHSANNDATALRPAVMPSAR